MLATFYRWIFGPPCRHPEWIEGVPANKMLGPVCHNQILSDGWTIYTCRDCGYVVVAPSNPGPGMGGKDWKRDGIPDDVDFEWEGK